ncbi:MAG: phosphoenolpyruvate--protein phosphotransferase, partial [Hylemonella sp.]|nr:phosphoenolpyruvate--protein phosphotransferase [Hylemonella sp.]
DPTPIMLAEYSYKQRRYELERGSLERLRTTPAMTLDGTKIELLANIEMPEDAKHAAESGADGVGLFRSEFLFMGRQHRLPDEEEQYQAYRQAVEGMSGLPVTIRTVDVGADKPMPAGGRENSHLNPALGLRAIRWSLADPEMFVTQLKAILRAAAHGPVHLLIPMLAHVTEIKQTMALLEQARTLLTKERRDFGQVQVGAMIEIPAAAMMVKTFLRYFDFLSIGTNDLIQYTLAIDRTDESVAHLYDPLHPAVLALVADTIAQCQAQGKEVSVCGEMAGDVSMTRLLLGMGLRSFSMHPTQILAVKQEVLRCDAAGLKAWAQSVVHSEEPASLIHG